MKDNFKTDETISRRTIHHDKSMAPGKRADGDGGGGGKTGQTGGNRVMEG